MLEAEVQSLLGSDAVQSCSWLPTFQRKGPPQFSGWETWRLYRRRTAKGNGRKVNGRRSG